MNKKEFISHEPRNEDAWICLCKNTPSDSGFFPCNDNGDEIEPLVGSAWDDKYVCANCGRIIDQNTLEVLGKNEDFQLLE